MNESTRIASQLRSRTAPHAAVGKRTTTHIWPIAALFVLALALLWWSLVAVPSLRVNVGAWGDQTVLHGVHGAESDANGDFRWTTGATTLTLPNLSSRYQLFTLRAHGWRPAGAEPPRVQMRVRQQAWGDFQTTPELRVYRVLLPRDNFSPATQISFNSSTYTPSNDTRNLGFALHDLALVATGWTSGPTVWQFGGQTLLVLLSVLLVEQVKAKRQKVEDFRWNLLPFAFSFLPLLLIAWANLTEPLWIAGALPHWLVVVGALLLATRLIAPALECVLVPWMTARHVRAVWALFVGGLALRLLGAVHPFFNAHDIDVHTSWLDIVNRGQLYLYSSPGELQNRAIFNPPGGYVLLMPLGLLLPSPRLVVQIGVALVDALGCLLLLPLARELRLSARAGLLALALATALPISTTMLWWGFATNALSQTAWLLLLWVLLRQARAPTWHGAAIFGMLCAVNVLLHIGTIVLVGATLGLTLLVALPRLSSPARRVLVGGALLAALVLTPIYFAVAAEPILAPGGKTFDLAASLGKGWRDRYLRTSLIWRGLTLGFTVPLLALTVTGVYQMLVARTRHVLQRSLLGVWLLVCVGCALAYLSVGLVTRYIYFAAPLVCLAGGVVLTGLRRDRMGRIVVLALVLLVAWTGTYLWVVGVLLRVKPSVVPLTH